MESYKINNLTFKYPASEKFALNDISLTIRKGEFVTICGPSGSGKSTLLSLLKPCLSPEGEQSGDILFEGENTESLEIEKQVRKIGFVMQSPENQIVTDKVWHELAFGLESLGLKNDEIRAKVGEMASFFGIEEWFHKKTTELSGGQKQILNLASVMVMQPSVLILDEPTSQLDPIAAQTFLDAVHKLNRELGITVILSEHRLEEALPFSDKMIVMENGSIIYDGKPSEWIKCLKDSESAMIQAMPASMRIHAFLDGQAKAPVTIREGKEFLEKYAQEHPFESIKRDNTDNHTEELLKIEDVYFRYEKNLPDVVKSLYMTVNKGEIYAILGGNGSGKSTLLSMICGINKPYRGKITADGEENVIGLLPQNPQSVFVEKTVEKDLNEMLSDIKTSKEEKERIFSDVVNLCQLKELLKRHPYDLSGGEMQRAALAKVLLRNPGILLLDEPTKGMDAEFKIKLAEILKSLKNKGVAVIIVSHDVEFCAKYADRCALLFDGKIVSENTPYEFFAGKSFYTTAANRISRGIIDGAVTVEDIVGAFGKKITISETDKKQKNDNLPENVHLYKKDKKQNDKNNKPLLISMILTVFIIMPLTVLAGIYLFDDKKYYFISLIMIIEAMIPFAISFEKRKITVRESVLIATLCAIAVGGRIAFFMVPYFKPIAAVVIITGVCMGAETGFLTGAVSAFVSNFYFSQGPWTTWQMFGLAVVGFVAGAIFHRGILPKKRIPLALFGIVSVTFLYGVIVDLSSLSNVSAPTWEYVISALALGFPFNAIHGLSTAFFLYVCAPVMIEKIERIKMKYGI